MAPSPPGPLLSSLRSALSDFAASPSTFRIIRSITRNPAPSSPANTPPQPPAAILVLDSSFNPPTRAHLHIAASAVRAGARSGPSSSGSSSTNASTSTDAVGSSSGGSPPQQQQRLLLLLATQNADKAPKPAAFEHRLAMMECLAEDLLDELGVGDRSGGGGGGAASASTSTTPAASALAVDIGLTKLPYFVDKAAAIAAAPEYTPSTQTPQPPQPTPNSSNLPRTSPSPPPPRPIPQTHLIGHDTLIRILDPKYYPPTHTLAPLAPLFAHHFLRVMPRPGGAWGGVEEQREVVRGLAEGEREGEGGRREWAGRVVVVDEGEGNGEGDGEGDREGVDIGKVSSTRLREGVGSGEEGVLEGLCSGRVAAWVKGQGLYRDGEERGGCGGGMG